MLGVTIYDVKDQHVKNRTTRAKMEGTMTMTQAMEFRRARWLEKLANMSADRNPRKLLVAWTPTSRLVGGQQQTIRRTFNNTLKKLELSPYLKKWIPVARNREEWARNVERQLGLKHMSCKHIHRKL